LNVEDEQIYENCAENVYSTLEEKDVLSHQFYFTSDYCLPGSYGFHSANSLKFAAENPKFLNNLVIAKYDDKFKVKFVVENPGTQQLLTSSFHPTSEMNYYGDLRLFFGPCFEKDFRPQTQAGLIYKLFFFNLS
jgi:type I restriction-modification system DNA methylase subunit